MRHGPITRNAGPKSTHGPRCSKTSAITKTGRRPELSQVGFILTTWIHCVTARKLLDLIQICWFPSIASAYPHDRPFKQNTLESKVMSRQTWQMAQRQTITVWQKYYSVTVYSLPLSLLISIFHSKEILGAILVPISN